MLACILWPYGRADNSPGTSQREDRLVADRTLGRLTRVPHSAITILNTNKARNLLGEQDLHKPVAITYMVGKSSK